MSKLAGTLVVLAVLSAACTSSLESEEPRPSQPERTSPSFAQPAPTTEPAPRLSGLVCWTAEPSTGTAEISMVNRTAEYGLVEPLVGMKGHAVAWSNGDGDGIELVFGTFADRDIEEYQVRGGSGPNPDTALELTGDTFAAAKGVPAVFGRTSGAAVVDLDGDGDDDLVLSRNMRDRERGNAPTQIYRNDPDGFTVIDIDLGPRFKGRSVGVLDFNADGLLDLFIVEDRFGGGSSVLLENQGGLRFTDATQAAGIPRDVHGLGIATSDVTGDGLTDIFIAGANRMFTADGSGRFVEAESRQFEWEVFGDEDDVSGAAIADLNRDGLPDLVVGHHYNSTLSDGTRVPIRVYLNRGADDAGLPRFEDVTEAAGLPGLPTKAPHVEVADLDNDGWPDLIASASASDGTAPAVFRHLGADPGGIPTFGSPSGLGDAQYWVSAPAADVDRDGRLDLFLVEWETSLPSKLLMNGTASGNWLEVSVDTSSGMHAIGTKVETFASGELIGMREIVASQGYAAGSLQVAHFGLGAADVVDVRVTLPDGEVVELDSVAANAHVRIPDGCG